MPKIIILYENDRHDMPYDTAIAICEIPHIDRECLLNEYTHFVGFQNNTLPKQIPVQLGMNRIQFSQKITVAQST